MASPITVLTRLVDLDLRLFAIAMFAALAVASECGYRVGRFQVRRRNSDQRSQSSITTITSGMLGLVAFSLGLTVSFAQTRYETRRLEVVQEANSIGTAWLRAKLVGGEAGEALANLIVDYTKVRLDYTRSDSIGSEERLVARTSDLQNAMWHTITPLARLNPTPIVATLVAALNDMFDQSLTQRTAFESRIPQALSVMLLCGSILSLGALGFQFGLAGERPLVLGALLITMWVGAMVLIVDFNRPRLGLLRVDPSPLIWTLDSFSNGPPASK